LLLKSDGTKFGKTAGGAVWLDPDSTSPYQFRQFWVQADDADVGRYLLQFTLLAISEVETIMAEHQTAPERRLAQRVLARHLTELVHGPDAAQAAEAAADVLFGGDPTTATPDVLAVVAREVPSSVVGPDALADVVELLTGVGLATSKSEARRLVAQHGVRANGRVLGADSVLSPSDLLAGRYVLLRKGKSTYHLAEVGER
jgi:tyrosyl-tRNA synthetase